MKKTIKKESKITRTVTFTAFDAIGVNLETMTIETTKVVLNDDWNDKELEEYRKEEGYASLKNIERFETVLECTLSEFISIAHESNRKVVK